MIRFRCTCGKKLKADPEIIGKKVRCTKCHRVNVVPAEDQLAPLPLAEKATPMAASLLPAAAADRGDDSASRFRLPPEDPPVSSESQAPSNPFDFDLDLLRDDGERPLITPQSSSGDLQIEPIAPAAFRRKPKASWVSPQRLMWGGGVLTALALVAAGIAWWFLSGPPFPESFESMTEVTFYRQTAGELRKAQQTFSVMSQAYLASEAPDEAQAQELRELADQMLSPEELDEPLYQAYRMLRRGEEQKAKTLLVAQAKANRSRVPELQSRAEALAEPGQ